MLIGYFLRILAFNPTTPGLSGALPYGDGPGRGETTAQAVPDAVSMPEGYHQESVVREKRSLFIGVWREEGNAFSPGGGDVCLMEF